MNNIDKYLDKVKVKFICAIIVIMIFAIGSCEDIFETDISGTKVHLNSPSNNLTTQQKSLTFWWDSIENAKKYNVQLVSRSFAELENVIMDTTVITTKIKRVLNPGTYQWRVCAFNDNYKAYSDTFTITVQSPNP